MNSTSSYGISQITLQFDLSRKIDAAAQDVQAAINAAAGWIPVGAAAEPADLSRGQSRRHAGADPGADLRHAAAARGQRLRADRDRRRSCRRSSGVGAVTVEGGQTRAVRLQINPAQLAGLGMSLDDVRRGIAATTADNPKGALDGPRAGVSDRRQRSAVHRRGLSRRGDRLSQRRAGAAARHRHRDRQRGGCRAGRLVQGHARRAARHPAPARRQHHPRRRRGQGAAAEAAGPRCRRR